MNSALQSLDHWQAIYIASIVIALLSTFAIAVFAFHIQEHKFGVRMGNHIYVAALLLAVLAITVILNNALFVGAGKDRVAEIAMDASNLTVVLAGSQGGGMTAEQSPVPLNDEAIEHLRTYLVPYAARHALHEDFKSNIGIEFNYGDNDSISLAKTIARAIPAPSQITPPRNSDTRYHGVTIVVKSLENIPPLAQALFDGLKAMQIDIRPVAEGNVRPFRFLVRVGTL